MNEISNSNFDEVHADSKVKDIIGLNDCKRVKLFVQDKKDCSNNKFDHCKKY